MAGVVAMAAVWLAAGVQRATETRLTILPAPRACMVWVDSPGTQGDWLIDCGDGVFALQTTIPFLRGQGVNRLEHFVLTHGDVQHVGGATNLMRFFRVGEVLSGPLPMLSQPYRQALALWTNQSRAVRVLRAGEDIGPWRILHPPTLGGFSRADDKALVLLGEWHGTRILVCPDLGPRGQNALLSSVADLQADILITSPSQENAVLPDPMLRRVRPGVVLLGEVPAHAPTRPALAVQRRLVRLGVPVVHLAESGAAVIRISRWGWTIETSNGFRKQGQRGASLRVP
jgi:competence protein ComEC